MRQNGTKRPGTATARDGGALSRDSPRPPQRHGHSSTRARKVTQCHTWAAGQPHGKAGPPWQLRQRHIVTSHTSTLKCTPIQPTAWCCFGVGARLRAQHPIRIDPARPPPGERDAVRPHVAIPAGRPSMQCEARRVSTLLQNGKSVTVTCRRVSTCVNTHQRTTQTSASDSGSRCSDGRQAGRGYPMVPWRRILTQSHTRHDAPSLFPRNVCAPQGRGPPGAGTNLRRSGAATGTGSAAKTKTFGRSGREPPPTLGSAPSLPHSHAPADLSSGNKTCIARTSFRITCRLETRTAIPERCCKLGRRRKTTV